MENQKKIKINFDVDDITVESLQPDQTEQKKENRYYLPVLNLNNLSFWESKPLSERKHWTDEKAFETCVGNCCNVKGLKAACCQLDPDDLEHVLGPVDEEDINLIIKKLTKKGIPVKRSDVVIDYEEGKIIGEKFFVNNKVFQDPKSYPFLRFQVNGPRFSCKYLSSETGKCNIYDFRPKMCANYLCSYVKTNFLVRTKDKPNTFVKLK